MTETTTPQGETTMPQSETTTPECDPDDLACQQATLEAMQNLQEKLGDGAFEAKFPELVETAGKLRAEIEQQRTVVGEAAAACGLSPEEAAAREVGAEEPARDVAADEDLGRSEA